MFVAAVASCGDDGFRLGRGHGPASFAAVASILHVATAVQEAYASAGSSPPWTVDLVHGHIAWRLDGPLEAERLLRALSCRLTVERFIDETFDSGGLAAMPSREENPS